MNETIMKVRRSNGIKEVVELVGIYHILTCTYCRCNLVRALEGDNDVLVSFGSELAGKEDKTVHIIGVCMDK